MINPSGPHPPLHVEFHIYFRQGGYVFAEFLKLQNSKSYEQEQINTF